MERTIEDYRSLLQVDQHRLDEALERQPMLYQEVATQAVYATSRADELKDLLKRKDNELSLAIRSAKDSSGIKYTEAVITAEILLDAERTALANDLHTQNRIAGEWSALRDAFSQRSYVLKDLAALFIAGYYASDVVRGRSPGVVAAQDSANRAAVQAARVATRPPLPKSVTSPTTRPRLGE